MKLYRENKLWHLINGKGHYIAHTLDQVMENWEKEIAFLDESNPSPDYPLGGSAEPYDIWRDDQLTNK